MPSYLEKYPQDRSSPYFLPLDHLVNDKQRRLSEYPSLERPRQKILDPKDSATFRAISRDYCLLESPGFTSWHRRKAQQEPRVIIFHTDVVRVPIADPGKRGRYHDPEHPDWTHDTYLNRWHLQGLTRGRVETLLMRNFGLSFPLSYESSAEHWIPAVQRYSVEVSENKWEDRLAIFFDANIATSMQSLGYRITTYGQELTKNRLGERYLEVWKARWEKVDDISSAELDVESAIIAPTIRAKESKKDVSALVGALVPGPKPRGRKRRRVLRQLKVGSPTLVMCAFPCIALMLISLAEQARGAASSSA
ncbi:hypothetical protein BDZ45DRAFT_125108 [Acephala macrosclerotiorum]|nr:hypothetical protein BDZ45DRAFT_125108 [Acephala macrosclerotiorum]